MWCLSRGSKDKWIKRKCGDNKSRQFFSLEIWLRKEWDIVWGHGKVQCLVEKVSYLKPPHQPYIFQKWCFNKYVKIKFNNFFSTHYLCFSPYVLSRIYTSTIQRDFKVKIFFILRCLVKLVRESMVVKMNAERIFFPTQNTFFIKKASIIPVFLN